MSGCLVLQPELIQRWGYPVETHRVRTQDGYLLATHRIPGGRGRPNEQLQLYRRLQLQQQQQLLQLAPGDVRRSQRYSARPGPGQDPSRGPGMGTPVVIGHGLCSTSEQWVIRNDSLGRLGCAPCPAPSPLAGQGSPQKDYRKKLLARPTERLYWAALCYYYCTFYFNNQRKVT